MLQDSVAGPEKSCQKAFLSLQLSHSRAGFAVTPSWLTSAWLLCLHNCSLHGCCTGWLSSLLCCQSIYVCQLANISPRHQHLWCYFSVCDISFAAHAESWALKLVTQVELDNYYLLFQHLKVHTKLCSRVMAWRDLLTLTAATDTLAANKLVTADFLATWWFDLYCRTAGKPSEIDRTERALERLTELTYCAIAGTPRSHLLGFCRGGTTRAPQWSN